MSRLMVLFMKIRELILGTHHYSINRMIMRKIMKKMLTIGFGLSIVCMSVTSGFSQSLWNLAKSDKDILKISTLFIAQDVRNFLSNTTGLDNAVSWCKKTGITRVFIESFRDGYYADRETLLRAKKRFLNEGFEVSGCVTTVKVGKDGIGGWGATACYTSKATLEELQRIFEFTASIFDEIMIDDFLFTECECESCIAARGDQSWSKFRCDLMVDVSRERILKPAKAVNPNVKIIIKFPLWYDQFHERGYDVIRESADFDKTWIGTETRDYDYNVRPGGEVQYNAYFITRWFGGIGGGKLGGGWIDALGTTPRTYLEQARQTVLGDAKEVMLFHYGDLQNEKNHYNGGDGTPVADVEALRKELPGLFELARIVHGKPVKGIHLPKLPDSEPFKEPYVFSFFGMLGLPLVPAHVINEQAESAIFTLHALKVPGFSDELQRMLNSGKQVVITDGLALSLTNQSLLGNKNLTVLKVGGDPKNLLKLTREELKPIRDKLLAPIGLKFDAPDKVGLYLFGDNNFMVENFNDEQVDVTLDFAHISDVRKVLILPEDGNAVLSLSSNSVRIRNLSPRTLVAVEYK
jgi:hypothetical protein